MSDAAPLLTGPLSVVIPSYGKSPHLRSVLKGILANSRAPDAVIVSHSGTHNPQEWIASEFPQVVVLHTCERLFAGAARNRGARHAGDGLIAFTDDDTVPARNWLQRVCENLSAHPGRFVVGSVGTAQTGGYWGMSLWLCEFSEQAPWRPAGIQAGGASCNLAMRKEDLKRAGWFPEDFRAGQDTMLLHALRTIGLVQMFDPSMKVDHYNISGFGHFRRHLINQGRHFAKVRRARKMPGSFATAFWPLSPLLAVAKAIRIFSRLIKSRRYADMIRFAPGIVIGSAIWGAGCAYAAATGRFSGRY